ncbi:helix-turn-helix domain-containing protein [Streptomyces sp. NPDC058128]|uniref:helix-turn-helix domain-containing protein n=1 Tax=Streptomyces sp. NPDC058128 TaxID=3346352 RepID=UPI0036E872BF
MTLSSQERTPCTNPRCNNTVEQKQKGRRRRYCSEECGRTYRRYFQPPPEATANDQYALALAEAAHLTTGEVLFLTSKTGEPLEASRLLYRALTELEHLRAALVQQAHDQKIKPSDVAAALHVSTDTVNRWRKEATERRERAKNSPAAPGPPAPTPSLSVPRPRSPRHPAPGPARSAPIGGAPGQPSSPVPSSTTPAASLARALSHLQRQNSPTYATLGEAIGVSRSYISRILSGERTPSWKVTLRLVEACDGDPEVVRPLWEAARGYQVAKPTSLPKALRGMQLAAGNIRPKELSARTGHVLTEQQVDGLLHGTQTADWPAVERLVTALRGHPATIHPLWQATQPSPTPSPHSLQTISLSAGSFG